MTLLASHLILLLLFSFVEATARQINALISSSSCNIFYTIDKSSFSFNNCIVSDQTQFTSWTVCLQKCCPVMPEGNYSTPSFENIKICQDSNAQNLDDVVKIIILALGAVFAVMVLICIITISISIYKSIKQNKINPETNNPEEITTVEWKDEKIINRDIDNLIWSKEKDKKSKQKIRKSNIDPICSICLEQQTPAQIICGHRFHPVCIGSWLQKSTGCPCCRRDNIRGIKVFCKKCWNYYLMCTRTLIIQKSKELVQYCDNCNLGLITRGSFDDLIQVQARDDAFSGLENHSKISIGFQNIEYP